MKGLIKKILREEYSPAGKEITPNRIVVHKSNPIFRDNIMSEGLKAKAGECYKIYVGYGTKCKPAIFATNSTNKRAWFDSTYDDDIWFIDTTKIPNVKWFKDRHFESTKKHIVTFDDIPPEALTLKYEGTGRDSGFINEIKEHPNPEKFIPYKNEIDKIVYSVVNKEELCGYRLEYFLNAGEDALQIVLYYKDGFYPGYEKHTEHAVDIKSMIENYLPIVNMAFVAFDSTACKKRITENVDEIEKNLKVINIILNEISWNGLCEIWVEYNEDDSEYEIRSKSTKRHFDHDEIVRELDYIDNTLRSMGLRTYIFTPWYVEECEDEVKFMNESKEKSTKELITTVLNTLVLPQYEHVICGFELKNVDDESLNNVINYPGVTVTFIGGYGTKMWPQTQAVQKMYDDVLDDIWETVWDYTGISLELYSKYVRDCGKENIYLREQKEETNYLPIIETLIEPFKEDECICNVDLWYDDEDDMYSVYLVFGTEELNDRLTSNGKFMYVRKKQKEVEETIKSYLPIKNIRVGSYGTPHCGWKSLNESNNKKNQDINILGTKLKPCSINPMTGFYRDGYCKTGEEDSGTHTVCARVNKKFLLYTKSKGNDLITPSNGFPGLKPGDKWCLCAKRWEEAVNDGIDIQIDSRATNIKTNDIVGNTEEEMLETNLELTERCWKGYTQKGYKTMFGKRYPNCVKNKN